MVWWLRAQTLDPDSSVWIPDLPLGILGKLLSLPLPWFPQRWKRDNKTTYLRGFLWRWNGLKVVQHLKQSLTPGQHHDNVNSCYWRHTWETGPRPWPSCGWPRHYVRVIITYGALVARDVIGFLYLPRFLISCLLWSLGNYKTVLFAFVSMTFNTNLQSCRYSRAPVLPLK